MCTGCGGRLEVVALWGKERCPSGWRSTTDFRILVFGREAVYRPGVGFGRATAVECKLTWTADWKYGRCIQDRGEFQNESTPVGSRQKVDQGSTE